MASLPSPISFVIPFEIEEGLRFYYFQCSRRLAWALGSPSGLEAPMALDSAGGGVESLTLHRAMGLSDSC